MQLPAYVPFGCTPAELPSISTPDGLAGQPILTIPGQVQIPPRSAVNLCAPASRATRPNLPVADPAWPFVVQLRNESAQIATVTAVGMSGEIVVRVHLATAAEIQLTRNSTQAWLDPGGWCTITARGEIACRLPREMVPGNVLAFTD